MIVTGAESMSPTIIVMVSGSVASLLGVRFVLFHIFNFELQIRNLLE